MNLKLLNVSSNKETSKRVTVIRFGYKILFKKQKKIVKYFKFYLQNLF